MSWCIVVKVASGVSRRSEKTLHSLLDVMVWLQRVGQEVSGRAFIANT